MGSASGTASMTFLDTVHVILLGTVILSAVVSRYRKLHLEG